MIPFRRYQVYSALLLATLSVSGLAETYRLSFTAQEFTDPYNFQVPPVNSVVGSFEFKANPANLRISSLLQVSLSILGQSYALADTGFESFSPTTYNVFGGLIGSVGGLNSATNDFRLRASKQVGGLNELVYTVASSPLGIFESTSVTVILSQVPEPSSYALLGFGVTLIAFRFSRSRIKASATAA